MVSIPNPPTIILFKAQPKCLILSHSSIENALRSNSFQLGLYPRRLNWRFCVRASNDGSHDPVSDNGAGNWKGVINSLPPAIFVVRRNIGSKYAVGICMSFALLAIVMRQLMLKKSNRNHQGSVADLVRRGQLRSDRRDTRNSAEEPDLLLFEDLPAQQ